MVLNLTKALSDISDNVDVHESIIRKMMNNRSVQVRLQLLSRKNIPAYPQFDKDHINKPESRWRNVL